MKGGRKNCDEDETKTTNDAPQEGRNNRRTLLITGGKLGCRPLKQRDRIKLRSEFVFPNRAWKALNVNWVTKALWPKLVEKAEVPYRPLMQTRHTYATLMLQKGAPIDWLQKQMGHRNLTMLIRHYWRWINPGELNHETLSRLGAVKMSSNQPQPDPTRANQDVSRGA